MASKFADFIEQKKLDPRRIVASSRRLERLRPEDRALKLATRRSRGEDKKPKEGEEKAAKPRSGRVVTPRLLDQAANGVKISGPAKTRLLRAVNSLLEQKKQEPIDIRALF